MRIELTLTHGDQTQDVAVVSAVPPSLAAIRGELAGACGIAEDAVLWSGDRALPPKALLGGDGLRTGSVISVGAPATTALSTGILSLHIVGGPDSGRIVALERGELTIGRDSDCDVVLRDVDASRRHCSIEVTSATITIRDLGSTNGTHVDGQPVDAAGAALRPGNIVRIGDTLLAVAGPEDAPAALHTADGGALLMLRPPRRSTTIDDREISLPVRAVPARPRGVQWITALVPAAAGGAVAWMTHSPQFLLFALLSPVMMVSNSLGDRVHWRRSRRRDAATFAERNAEAQRQISVGLREETDARRAAAPDPAAVLRLVSLPSSRLWERRRDDVDLLRLRIGTADLPSTLRSSAGALRKPAGTVSAVPLCVDLRDGPLGIAGPPDVVIGMSRWLVGQLAALHSPGDLQLALLLCLRSAESWQWARWLPHLGTRVAASADEWPALVTELAAAVEQRCRAHGIDASSWRGPWLVVVIDRSAALADVPGLSALVERGRAVGLTAICLDDDVSRLPAVCRTVTHVVGVTGTRICVGPTGLRETVGIADQVSATWADELARGLAPLSDAGAPGSVSLPDVCRLSDVLHADVLDPTMITHGWATASGTAQTVLGWSTDGPLRVDLVDDGPHALIAGTTGAGKSELLQTLVIGLAVNHPPDDVNFLLIDYKGGAAFADCARLPHTAGLVTDLDSYLTARALRSLDSELRRRERLFAVAGTADLAGYRAADAPTPIARLIIVVDEFAALADELPDFVRGLVAVAQRGRSLGVHLVLATQRPGSAISAEIRANTTLRIALRVTDPAESTDVINAMDAALIERSKPGRAYVRAGSTLTCFQAAHPGSTSRPDADAPVVEVLDVWRRGRPVPPTPTGVSDLAAIVDALRTAAEQSGRTVATTPWLPPLPADLGRADLEWDQAADTSVAFGLVDLPAEQHQATISLDLARASSLLAAGAPRSGRTTLLASIALGAATRLGPDRLQLYVIDPTGGLATVSSQLPHCATIAGPEDPALVLRLLRRLDEECTRRVSNCGNAGAAMLLLVDGWESLIASLADVEAALCTDLLAGLLRAGPAAGLTIAVTGDRTSLAPRISGAFATKIVLRLADVSDYGLAGISPRDVPRSMPVGRALRTSDAAALQIAHVGLTGDIDEARRVAARLAAAWPHDPACGVNDGAIRIRALPPRVSLDDLPAKAGRLSVGLVGDAVVPLQIDLFAGAGRVLVAGPPRSGRSTLLRSLLAQAHASGLSTVVAAGSRSPLAAAARQASVLVVDPSDRADVIGAVPRTRTLLLIDDSESFVDAEVGDRLVAWIRASGAQLAAVVAGRADDLATTYRGVGAEVRRSHCGILLRPGPMDGELLGVRLTRRPSAGPPGRGVVLGDPSWGPMFSDAEPLPIQIAAP